MTNPFAAHGIKHLSASQLTTFASDPSRWFAQKVLGYRSPSGAAMERGKAVENGVVYTFRGDAVDEATRKALSDYDRSCRFSNILGDVSAEREHIAPMIEQALAGVAKFGDPTFPAEGQHKIEIPIRFGTGEDDTIPIIGFLDFMFSDRIIDLKSTMRIPSDMSFSHRIQAAIYSRTTNKPVQFLYVSPKRSLLLEDSDTAASQAAARAIVQRMAAFLSLSPDREILRAAVPVITDSWGWRGEEDARRQFFGI